MEKFIELPPFDQYGEPNVRLIIPESYEITKIASSYDYPEELTNFILALKSDPLYLYLLINAVGAFEFWGFNKNGDGFPEKYLLETQTLSETRDGIPPIPRYKTFEKYARLYKQHKKANPDYDNVGNILLSVYDHKMHRTLIIAKFIRARDPNIAWKIENGYGVLTSMGCKVPFDICSICGNEAPSRKDYCIHLKNYMGKILGDGRAVGAFNTKPRFDDISFVHLAAWVPSRVIIKVAKKRNQPPRKFYSIPFLVKQSIAKESDIEKEIPGQVMSNVEKLKYNEPMIKKDDLNYISKFTLPQILASFYIMGMQPKPQELQRVIIKKANQYILEKTGTYNLADEFDKQGIFLNEDYQYQEKIAFDPTDVRYEICRVLYDSIPERSVFGKHLESRLANEKIAQYSSVPPIESAAGVSSAIIPLAAFLAGAMIIFRMKGLNFGKFFPSFVKANKWFIPAIIGGGALLSSVIATEPPSRRYWPNIEHQKAASVFSALKTLGRFTGKGIKLTGKGVTFGVQHPSALIAGGALPAAYLGAGYIQAREQSGLRTSPAVKFVERHPFMTGSTVSAISLLRYLKSIAKIK